MLSNVGWERHLQEMVLAGGALTATGCGGSTLAQSDAASNEVSAERGDATAPGDDATSSNSTSCCNADPDPCCPMLACAGGVGSDDPAYLRCEARYQCEDFMNGIYQQEPDGALVCTPRCQLTGQCPDAAPASPDSADASSDACVRGVCTVSCIDGGSGGVQGCVVEPCCVRDDAGADVGEE